jgi:predicted transcriptional regulator
LERILSLWGLSNAAAARMFGVSRQAFSKWLHNGPPANRATSVADLAAVTDLLARYVKRERIPAIVRRQAPAFEGVSLLHLAEQGRTGEALDRVRATFDLRRVQP